MAKAKQSELSQPRPDTPAADSILDKLLRAADLRADHLLSRAKGERDEAGVWIPFDDADSIELTTLMGSVARVADMDLRHLEKHDPRALQARLTERVQAGAQGAQEGPHGDDE